MAEPSNSSQTLRTYPAGQIPAGGKVRSPAQDKRLQFQRTLIPILLTLGVIFCLLGGAQWTAGADEAYSAASMRWSAITLPIMGLLMLGLAATNMISVRRKLGNRA